MNQTATNGEAGRGLGAATLLGDSVRVKDGATAWMKQRGFWLKDWPDSIDGMDFVVVADYTRLGGESSHWWLENETVKDCGVHPMWIAPNAQGVPAAAGGTETIKKPCPPLGTTA